LERLTVIDWICAVSNIAKKSMYRASLRWATRQSKKKLDCLGRVDGWSSRKLFAAKYKESRRKR